MIEFEGQTNECGVVVTVFLDSVEVGVLQLTLAQWDRLREHRRERPPSVAVGYQIIVAAKGDPLS